MDNKVYIQHLNDFACKAQIKSSPEDTVEQQLQSLWADVLDRPICSIDTTIPFTQFGADSLDVIRFISKTRARGIEFDIPQVYASKAIQQLAHIQQPLLQQQTAIQKPVYQSFSAITVNLPLGILIKNASTICQVRVEDIKDIQDNTVPSWPDDCGLEITRDICLRVIDVEAGRRDLALGLSHAQYDGFCLPTILNNLSLAYAAGKRWENPSRPRYRDFSKHTANQCNEESDCFWREKLKGSTLTSIVRRLGRNARPIMSQGLKQIIPFQFNKHFGTVSYPVMLKVAWAIGQGGQDSAEA
ncbi:nonribosomal peptide synthase, putative [Beauveria bassiana ARSEF 2860]|uniref:Nonribosomal peptide synthase, putative n=1 Tax=Beauveria bassiana (strain ARSEF 2860) TaxID=655819 RepID=J4KMN8_BEAB2|nr:nonribosomal peptide synthase, putative [Beauveria bassiana ARSEF 2860]EJP64279.1 nonribosomal peptide synthase, putative [Beauveria bassiana ARSEF 2860]